MNKIKMMFLTATGLMFTSCATILSGGSPKVTIDGNISEPVTITTAKQVYENVTLPCVVKVNRHKIDEQRIQVRSATQRYSDVVLTKKINGVTWANILLGGLIGWGIDLCTNCVSKPEQTMFYVHPVENTQPSQSQTNNDNTPKEVE